MTRKEMLLLRQSITSLPVHERERVIKKLKNPEQFRVYVEFMPSLTLGCHCLARLLLFALSHRCDLAF